MDQTSLFKTVAQKFKKRLPISYELVRPPGLTKQRNVGIKSVNKKSTWVGFLDDDLVLEPTCLGALEDYLLSVEGYRGIGLTINNQPKSKKSEAWVKKVFLIENYPAGKITSSGHAGTITAVDEHTRVDWLYGGATFWQREVFDEFAYDEWYSGVGYMEDVDFSYRVAKTRKVRSLCHGSMFSLSP